MKIFVLLLIIFLILFVFRLFQSKFKSSANQDKKDQNIIDLEKDPKTDEYKPKEQMKLQIIKCAEDVKENFFWTSYGF